MNFLKSFFSSTTALITYICVCFLTPAMALTNISSKEHPTPTKKVNSLSEVTSLSDTYPGQLSAYQPNYILPIHYSMKAPSIQTGPSKNMNLEVKFQLSVKSDLWPKIFSTPISLYVAYTQTSYWQAYSSSAFFRESNYEPTLFFQYQFKNRPAFHLQNISIGAMHQSNGLGGNLERSWNRAYLNIAMSNQDIFLLQIEPWIRIYGVLESKDYNPDITTYLGYGQIIASYQYKKNVFSIMARNILESKFKYGAIEASWSFPIYKGFRGMLQIFNGYGEDLIDYNHSNTSISLGIDVTDWLFPS